MSGTYRVRDPVSGTWSAPEDWPRKHCVVIHLQDKWLQSIVYGLGMVPGMVLPS